jgi:hypothetical protein
MLFSLLVCASLYTTVANRADAIREALLATNQVLFDIETRWEIADFPNFLQTGAMPPHSYQVLVNRFTQHILKDPTYSLLVSSKVRKDKANEDTSGEKERRLDAIGTGQSSTRHLDEFIISFMGSSVTAGHDTKFNNTMVPLVEKLMAPAFAPLGVRLITRMAALGNNPCMPYDACPKAFSGDDTDMVHWEQSYNCFAFHNDKRTRTAFEQFVRQV